MNKFIKKWLKEIEEKNIHHRSFSTKWISCKNDFAETQKNRKDYFENDDLINKFEKTFRSIYGK